MTLVNRIKSFFKWSAPLREIFGTLYGLQIAARLRQAIWAAPPGSLVKVAVPSWKHPLWLRAGKSDASVFLQVFAEQQGFFPVSGNPRLIVDAGANIGLTSLCLANRFPQSQIVSLEVDAGNYDLLKKNCLLYGNITPLFCGVWSHSTHLLIENTGGEAWAYQTKEVTAQTLGAIRAVGISDLLQQLAQSRIDLLKIDIEGAEYELFSRGLDDWIDKVSNLVVEIHEGIRPGVKDLVHSSMRERGFFVSSWGEYQIFSRQE